MSLFSWMSGRGVSGPEVRAEIWKLGALYRGFPLEGALEELKTGKPDAVRARLLRACVAELRLQ